jgi:hypothetical protein
MEVLVFANPKDPAKERFFYEISKVPRLSPKFVLEPEGLIAILKNASIDWRAVVFFAHDRDDLALALSLKTHLIDTRVIMVLSDWNRETVEKGLALAPSLIVNADADFSAVIAVLEKLSASAQ